MYKISKDFAFEASHRLHGLEDGHKCMRMHGHSYVVRLVLESTHLDEHGFVIDYADLDIVKQFIDQNMDHRHLNDLVDGNPTAEVIARMIFGMFSDDFAELTEVWVSETAKTWAIYRG